MKATAIAEQTCVGTWGEFPRDNGNCFCVVCDDGHHYRVVNFYVENLEEAVRRGIVWPIEAKLISERHCVIHDSRIPDSWYSGTFCEVCCPKSLLPLPQLLAHERAIAGGWRMESEHSVCIDPAKMPSLSVPSPNDAKLEPVTFTLGEPKIYGYINFPKRLTGEQT